MHRIAGVMVGCALVSSIARAEPVSLIDRTPWLPRGETEVAPRLSLPVRLDTPDDVLVDATWLDLDARHSFGWIEAFAGATYAPHIPNLGQPFDGEARAGARVPLTCMSDLALRGTWALPNYRTVDQYEWAERRAFTIEAAWEWKVPAWYVISDDWARSLAIFGDVRLDYTHAHYQVLIPDDPLQPIPPAVNTNAAYVIADVGVVAQASTGFAIAFGARIVPLQLVHGADLAPWHRDDYYLSLIKAHASWDLAMTIASSDSLHPDPNGSSLEISISGAARF